MSSGQFQLAKQGSASYMSIGVRHLWSACSTVVAVLGASGKTIQKTVDIYHNPPWFVAPFTYERSQGYPNGHRNVIFADRGIRTLPRSTIVR